MIRYAILCAIFAATTAGAATVGDTKINGANVTKGALKLDVFGGFSDGFQKTDGTAFKTNVELSYGITDWWKVGAYAVFDKATDENMDYAKSELITVLQFTKEDTAGFDSGLYLSYEPSHISKADEVGAMLLWGKEWNLPHEQEIEAKVNLGFGAQVGSNRTNAVDGSLDAGLYYDLPNDSPWELGVEYFSDVDDVQHFGKLRNQNHRAGVVVEYEIPGIKNMEVQLGWLVGLTDKAPDNTIKYQLEYKF